MGSPRHLWTGEWRAESDQSRDDGASALHRTAPPRPASDTPQEPPTPPKRSRAGMWVLGLLLVLVAVGGGIAAGAFLLGGDDDTPEALPALSSRPIRPEAGQTRAGAIYAQASPAVVSIRTDTGQGTGFLIEGNGTIVTNYHVTAGASHVVVKFGQDGAAIDGDVLGTDESSDLAVVSIERDRIPRGVRPLAFADSRNVQVGDFAVAIGNPFGLDRTVTEGIVSGLGRSIQAPNGFEIDEVIQTDAPINPGNSGGPLLDSGGRVIGVNSQIATNGMSQGNIGIGFAVPSNTARQIVPKLERGEKISRPYLGISTSPITSTGTGARVAQVRADSPAQRAGVQVGDVVKTVNGRSVTEPGDVAANISRNQPGDRIQMQVERDGRTLTLDVTLGDRADAPLSFAAPLVLLALVAVPLLALWYLLMQRNRRAAAAAFAAPRMQPAVAPRRPGWRRHLPMAVFLLAVAALIVAAARPQRTEAVPVERASIVLLTDVSGSMLATDVEPNRLIAAKRAARRFVDRVPEKVNVGVIAFSTSATVLQSPTRDRLDVENAIDRLTVSGTTATGDAIRTALSVLKHAAGRERQTAAVGDRADLRRQVGPRRRPDRPSPARRRDSRIPIYTVAFGTDAGTITTDGPGGEERVERVPPDPAALAQIAEVTGAQTYSRAGRRQTEHGLRETRIAARDPRREETDNRPPSRLAGWCCCWPAPASRCAGSAAPSDRDTGAEDTVTFDIPPTPEQPQEQPPERFPRRRPRATRSRRRCTRSSA